MDRPFVVENDRERKRLQLLVERIIDEELSFQMWEGGQLQPHLPILRFGITALWR